MRIIFERFIRVGGCFDGEVFGMRECVLVDKEKLKMVGGKNYSFG
jgi:hypothetical protein